MSKMPPKGKIILGGLGGIILTAISAIIVILAHVTGPDWLGAMIGVVSGSSGVLFGYIVYHMIHKEK